MNPTSFFFFFFFFFFPFKCNKYKKNENKNKFWGKNAKEEKREEQLAKFVKKLV